MPHQCVHCGKVYPNASKELIEGCSCGSHFFYFIKHDLNKIEKQHSEEINLMKDISLSDKKQIEKDVREMIGLENEEIPVILDLESIKITGPGKFVLDVVNLFDRKRPLIYKLDEGKYIVDLASTINNVSMNEIRKKIRPSKPKGNKDEKNQQKKEEKHEEIQSKDSTDS